MSTDNLIIIKTSQTIKRFTTKRYETIMHSIDLSQLVCPYCQKSHFNYHDYYPRSLRVNDRKIIFEITRIECQTCGKTHALLCEPMIPYNTHLFGVFVLLIEDPEKSELDKSLVQYYQNRLNLPSSWTYENLCQLFSRNTAF